MYSLLTLTLALALSPGAAWAAVSPTSPSGDTVVRVGQPLNALWTADGTGAWTDTVIQLMTGDNFQMIPLQVLSQGVDGTKDTQASWTAPNVTPNSKIYFLQFTQGGDVSTATWTTRFTIAAEDGSTTPPTNSTSGIAWGVGQLVGADGQPIPNPTTGNINVVAAGGGAGSSGSGSDSLSRVNSSASASGTVSQNQGAGPATISVSATTASTSASATDEPASTSVSASASASASPSSTSSGSATRPASANATTSNAAGKLAVGGWVAAVAGLVGVAFI